MAAVLDVISWVLLLTGAFFVITGGTGLVRLPDFYTRVHAAGMTDTLGTWLIMLGLIVQAGSFLVAVKLLMILFFLLMTSPLSSHLLTKAAWLDGLPPWTGRGTGKGTEGRDAA